MKFSTASVLVAAALAAQVDSVHAKLGDEWNVRGANQQKEDRNLGSGTGTGSGSSKSKSGSKADLVADIGDYPPVPSPTRRLEGISDQKHRELCRRLGDAPTDDEHRKLPVCINPSGTVEVSFKKNGNITIKVDLTGLAPDCDGTDTAPNACGIHIHEGTTCNTHALIGGHFWKTTEFTTDPWATIEYTSDANGDSMTEVTLDGGNGYGEEINFARAFVIHDDEGNRIGCGLLEKA